MRYEVNHFALFIKLLDHNVPIALLNILINWYTVCAAVVRWDNVFSTTVKLQCGVRQGGVLSPVLFIVYVNDVIVTLSKSGHGCYYNNMFIGCIMYADDLLLLSGSLCDLQSMVDICCNEFDKLDMCLNVKKSQVIRIGRTYRKEVSSISINGKPVQFVDEMKYLGWHIMSANRFKVNLHHMRVHFFQSFNALYAKSSDFSEPVLQHLVNVYCKPYLLYGAEVINWNNSELSSIRHAFNSAMCKVYKVKCQLLDSIYDFTNQRDIVQDIYHRRRSFDLKLLFSNNLVVKHVCAVGSF